MLGLLGSSPLSSPDSGPWPPWLPWPRWPARCRPRFASSDAELLGRAGTASTESFGPGLEQIRPNPWDSDGFSGFVSQLEDSFDVRKKDGKITTITGISCGSWRGPHIWC